MNTAKVIFQPSGRRGSVPRGVSILEASRLLGVDVASPCGAKQVCGKCKIRIEQGNFQKFGIVSNMNHAGPWQSGEEEHITAAEREAGYRLACASTVEDDLLIFVPESSQAGKQVVSKTARPIDIVINPAVKPYSVELKPPSLEDPAGNFERLCSALIRQHGLDCVGIDPSVLRKLQHTLERAEWKVIVAVWMDREIIQVMPGPEKNLFGLAIDVGTTTVAAYLCDLNSGQVLDTLSMMNPQVKYGEDVVSRISFHMENPDGLERMSMDLVAGLNSLVSKIPKRDYILRSHAANGDLEPERNVRIQTGDIVDVSIVGNTAMHHILLQLDPEPLGRIPFAPAIQQSLYIKARDIGLDVNPAARVFMLPIEAGFVGGDNVGVILSEEPHVKDQIQLIIDIGTNGELVLGNNKKLLCSSCATGPALEGAQIEFGMRAAPGAIERLIIDPDTLDVDYKVVGREVWRSYSKPREMLAKGICGSGILDAVAQLFIAGIVDSSGAFNLKQSSSRLRRNSETDMMEFVLAWSEDTSIDRDIVITQKDIRQIQLAKAAIYTGCKLMMRKLEIDRLDLVKIAGAFGSHIDCKLALAIGMFPDCAIDNIVSVGNAAGDGCRAALLNRDKRREADRVAREVEYMELTLEEDFQQQLMDAIHFPHKIDAFNNLVGVVPDHLLE